MAQSKPSSIYFGYGSNMWKDQVARRCSESKFLGIAHLKGWKWIISDRGHANIIKSPSDSVYGLVYDLPEADEALLAGYENVPDVYSREYLSVSFLGTKDAPEQKEIEVLVYIDFLGTKEGKPGEEYIYRMNQAFGDAIKEGVPEVYLEEYTRSFVPKK